jgi:hypothetical protein
MELIVSILQTSEVQSQLKGARLIPFIQPAPTNAVWAIVTSSVRVRVQSDLIPVDYFLNNHKNLLAN